MPMSPGLPNFCSPVPSASTVLLSHPTGNTNVRALLGALEEAGRLEAFLTTVAIVKSDWYLQLLPKSFTRELQRRTYHLPTSRVDAYPYRELVRLVAQRLGPRGLCAHETGWASIDAVWRELDCRAARRRSSRLGGVYAYEDGAVHTFRAARRLGLKCLYDLPIGYWRAARQIQEEEAQLQPEWSATLTAVCDSAEKLARKDEELLLADVVFVASSFTQRTLQLATNLTAPVVVIPYGSPPLHLAHRPTSRQEKLRVLFVGSLGQRKGTSYLLDAVAQLGDRVELTLIGQPTGPCRPLTQALNTYRWIASLPHAEVLEEMRRHDVFVFPSLFEGFGLVILEAMSQGLPVITTPNTAGPDIISDGKDGFIVPIRSAQAIAQKLELLINNRDLLEQLSQAAQHKAATFTWKSYQHKAVEAIDKVLASSSTLECKE